MQEHICQKAPRLSQEHPRRRGEFQITHPERERMIKEKQKKHIYQTYKQKHTDIDKQEFCQHVAFCEPILQISKNTVHYSSL